jgi:hypothetical protein
MATTDAEWTKMSRRSRARVVTASITGTMSTTLEKSKT